jgi:hypothetical protein
MTKNNKKFNYSLLGIVVAIIGVLVTILANYKKIIEVFNPTPISKEVKLYSLTESGEPLAGVKIFVVGDGAPENQYTDSNGYVKLKISSQGDVRVKLSKKDCPSKDLIINLDNDQNIVREIRFDKSCQTEIRSIPISSKPSPSTPLPESTVNSTLSPNSSVIANNPIQLDVDVTWELKKCQRKNTTVSCYFILTTTNTRKNYEVRLNNDTKLTDFKGQEYFISKASFVNYVYIRDPNVFPILNHEVQSGASYDLVLSFDGIPDSIKSFNSLTISQTSLKFDNISIQ